jgi:23S rRNA (guanine745-N1)-methyltransferase
MLDDAVSLLICPVCGAELAAAESALRCPSGHTFDIARQGYVNLLPGNARPGTADTAQMAQARSAFLGAGHFAWLADLLASSLAGDAVLDAGAGTGYYLGHVLERAPGSVGLALDLSKHALRRAARAHPRIGAVVADLWSPLPVRTASVDAVLNVFAPRNGPEFRRVLRPHGLLHVVTPTDRHLAELITDLGLLKVDSQKAQRTERTLTGHFELAERSSASHEVRLSHAELATLVGMGPSAHHLSPEELTARIAKLPDPAEVTLSVSLSTYRPTV